MLRLLEEIVIPMTTAHGPLILQYYLYYEKYYDYSYY